MPSFPTEVPLLAEIASVLGVPVSAIAGQTEVPLLTLILGGITNLIDSIPGAATWGSITGTLSSQADLQGALDLKAPIAGPTFTGVVTLANGAEGAPSLNFGDATTGFWRRSANAVCLSIAGTAKVLFDGSVQQMVSAGTLEWSAGAIGSSTDTFLSRQAAGVVASNGFFRTAAPAGGTAANWKFGIAASVSPTSPNRTIELDVGGTIFYLAAKTTNN